MGWGGLGRGAQWARGACWDGPCRGRAALLVACGGNPVRDRQRVPWARLACACASCPSRPWWNGTGPAAVDRRSLRLTARARAKRLAQVRHGRQHVRCARVREHAGSITTPSTTTRPRRRPWQGGGRGAVECTWCMGVCSGAQLSRSPHRQPRTRRTSTRARARTHLKLLSDTASLPVLQPDTLAGLPWGGVLLPRGCCTVVNEGCGRNTATRIVPKPWQLATNGFH